MKLSKISPIIALCFLLLPFLLFTKFAGNISLPNYLDSNSTSSSTTDSNTTYDTSTVISPTGNTPIIDMATSNQPTSDIMYLWVLNYSTVTNTYNDLTIYTTTIRYFFSNSNTEYTLPSTVHGIGLNSTSPITSFYFNYYYKSNSASIPYTKLFNDFLLIDLSLLNNSTYTYIATGDNLLSSQSSYLSTCYGFIPLTYNETINTTNNITNINTSYSGLKDTNQMLYEFINLFSTNEIGSTIKSIFTSIGIYNTSVNTSYTLDFVIAYLSYLIVVIILFIMIQVLCLPIYLIDKLQFNKKRKELEK